MAKKLILIITFIAVLIAGFLVYKSLPKKPYVKLSSRDISNRLGLGLIAHEPIAIDGSPYKYLLEELEYNYTIIHLNISFALQKYKENLMQQLFKKAGSYKKRTLSFSIGQYPFQYETLRWQVIKALTKKEFKIPNDVYVEMERIYTIFEDMNEYQANRVKNEKLQKPIDQELANKNMLIIHQIEFAIEKIKSKIKN
ncbi:MAG: hypothetical protein GY817_01380 [bacterium]|nr:hypothetical protein [bacterium]